MKYAVGFIFYLLMIVAGLYFPDVDRYIQISQVMVYRAALTYSIILPLIWYYTAGKREIVNRFIGMGLFLGLSVRLTFELYPIVFEGGAGIYLPLIGRFYFLPAELASVVTLLVSAVWLIANVYLGLRYYFKLTYRRQWFRIMSIVFIPLTFYGYAVYSGRYWIVSLVFMVSVFVVLFSRERSLIK
ncbi:MAG: hypothetical protein ACOC5A_04865 [Halanaerobiales bacterium]